MEQNKIKKIILILVLGFLILPITATAADSEVNYFEAKVLKVLAERQVDRGEEGTAGWQQNVRIKALDGEWEGQEMEIIGINEYDVVTGTEVKVGDRVLVEGNSRDGGKTDLVIIDQVRRSWLYLLGGLFAVLTVLIGRWQGMKSLISLVITFFIIMYFIIPRIVAGNSPLLISLIGSMVILASIVYVTWGFKKKAHVAAVSIFVSLVLTGLLAILFTGLTKLSGLADDNILHLVANLEMNFRGLLLAGIVIGTLGVLDDVVIGQISTVEQLIEANKNFSRGELFKRAMRVGVDHISSMTNTLFLAYAGASLPLLLLFHVRQEPFVKFSQIINNEVIAVEIVRTLTGSLGLVLAVPIATVVAVVVFRKSARL